MKQEYSGVILPRPIFGYLATRDNAEQWTPIFRTASTPLFWPQLKWGELKRRRLVFTLMLKKEEKNLGGTESPDRY